MIRILTAALFLAAPAKVVLAAPTSLDCLHFLVGNWTGDSTGDDHGLGFFRFESKINGKVILRTNHADYPAQNGHPSSVHDDLMAIEPDGAGLKATYVDNEGNAILYSVQCSSDEKSAVFLSQAESAPHFRLSYRLTDEGNLEGLFEVAFRGSVFSPYRRWIGRPKT
jgi:hypothetical protein